MSDVCFEMLNLAQLDRHWVEEYKKGRPYDSRYASRRKKETKDETKTTSVDREKLDKLVAVCDLLDIDLNRLTR